MKILIADINKNRLSELSGNLAKLIPDGEITAETDSLMAGKDCFTKAFDVVFANLDDRRLDGLKMKEFVRRSNPDAKFFLCGNTHDLYEWNIIDDDGNICEEGIDGAISFPVTKEKLIELLKAQSVISVANSAVGTELDGTNWYDQNNLCPADRKVI